MDRRLPRWILAALLLAADGVDAEERRAEEIGERDRWLKEVGDELRGLNLGPATRDRILESLRTAPPSRD